MEFVEELREQPYQHPYPGEYYGDSLQSPMSGGIPVSQDNHFMKWLFSFRKEVVVPLRHIWEGYYYDLNKESWVEPINGKTPLLNDKGIAWAISLIESYISPVYVVTNMDETKMNHLMRSVIRDIWNNLSTRYKEFGLNKLDIPRVSNEIESKILAILMGARGDGYRTFFSKQIHVSEHHQPGMEQMNQKSSGGFLSGIKNLFSPKNLQQTFDYSSQSGYQNQMYQ